MQPCRLVFLLDTQTTAGRWSEFMAYFARRDYSCYTAGWPPGEMPSSAVEYDRSYLFAAGAMTAQIAHPDAWQRADGLVLFAPPLWTLLRLGRRSSSALGDLPSDLPPVWAGYGARQTSARMAIWFRRHLQRSRTRLPAPYVFQGLGADLPFRPGWERVAYSVRLWLESQVDR